MSACFEAFDKGHWLGRSLLSHHKSFAMTMESDASDAKFVRSTIDLAHHGSVLTGVAPGGKRGHCIVQRHQQARACDGRQAADAGAAKPNFDFSG